VPSSSVVLPAGVQVSPKDRDAIVASIATSSAMQSDEAAEGEGEAES